MLRASFITSSSESQAIIPGAATDWVESRSGNSDKRNRNGNRNGNGNRDGNGKSTVMLLIRGRPSEDASPSFYLPGSGPGPFFSDLISNCVDLWRVSRREV